MVLVLDRHDQVVVLLLLNRNPFLSPWLSLPVRAQGSISCGSYPTAETAPSTS